jgi:iron(III) transport system substrate-binding protein
MNSFRVASALGLVLAVGFAQERKVVCYVSHDFEHAEAVLKAFEAKSGVKVEAVPDTEDNKTVGLVNRIIAENGKPRGDVFWNNEAAQAARLKARGLLEAYRSPNAEGIPAAFKDADGYWTGFAARARAIIYNTKLVAEGDVPRRVADLADPRWKGKGCAARPLTGSTLTHFALLSARDGLDATVGLLERMIANDVLWEKGNAMVMRQVGEGARPFGLTDTDDAWVSELRGFPTRYFLPDQGADDAGVLLFPNTAMILKGAAHPTEARALVDYLLSAECEEALAKGAAAQIPLRKGVPRPAHVKGADEIKALVVDWNKVGAAIDAALPAFEAQFAPQPSGRGSLVVGGAALLAVVLMLLFRGRRASAHGAA